MRLNFLTITRVRCARARGELSLSVRFAAVEKTVAGQNDDLRRKQMAASASLTAGQ